MAYRIISTRDRSLLRTWRSAREWMHSPWSGRYGRSEALVHSRKYRPVFSATTRYPKCFAIGPVVCAITRST